jgi:AraC-like DNA-binding protein
MKTSKLTLDLRSYSVESHTHQHDYHQLVLPVSGILSMDVGNQQGDVKNFQAAVIAAGQDHGFAGSVENSFVVANVPIYLAPQLERLPVFIELDDSMAQYVRFLHQQLQIGASNCEKQMLILLLELLQERFGKTLNLDRRIEVSRNYLDANFSQNISLPQLAAIANLSPRQLSELFRLQLGMTPSQYLIEKRMQSAWHLLKTTQLSIQQISEQVGYSNLSAFSDRFSKHFGRSPRYFRHSGK